MTQTNTYDPEQWLQSTARALKEYADAAFNDAYEVVMEFPSTDKILTTMPLPKTIVHFEIDIIDDRLLGMGENIGDYNYDSVAETTQPQEAAIHVINFDVGSWSSDRSGGTTSRMRVKETLALLFHGNDAQANLNAAVNDGDGTIEILNFTGGRFITDRINDIDVYRLIDSSLDVRVFSRRPLVATPVVPSIEEIIADDSLVTLPE